MGCCRHSRHSRRHSPQPQPPSRALQKSRPCAVVLLPLLLLLVLLGEAAGGGAAGGQQQCSSSTDAAAADAGRQHRYLVQVAAALVAPGRGVLAADESTATMGKRFERVGVANTPQNRAAWRAALLTAPGLAATISGVILTEDTLQQPLHTRGEAPASRLVDHLLAQGVAVGAKVDRGLVPLNSAKGSGGGDTQETQARDMAGLADRCVQARQQGATFAKFRAVFRVDDARGWPSQAVVAVNAGQLATFAAAAQAAGLVPLVEPEVLMREGTHSLAASEAACTRVLAAVVAALQAEPGVLLEGLLLKPAMVLPGSNSAYPVAALEDADAVQAAAAATLRVLRRTVPPAVPGIAFLSGGQSEEEAAALLAAINQQAAAQQPCVPWRLTYSFGRALQASALQAWAAAPGDVGGVHRVFARVAAAAAAASEAGGGGGDAPAGT